MEPVAFDISIGDSTPEAASAHIETFDDFYERHAHELGTALQLVAQNPSVASRSLSLCLERAAQRWRQLATHENPAGWTFRRGVDEIAKSLSEQASNYVNEATGGYVRGLPLDEAVEALPVQQRGALVAAYLLDWTDEVTAIGFGTATSTVTTRRKRGLNFVSHHLQSDADPAVLVREYFADQARAIESTLPDKTSVVRRGRRRNLVVRSAIGIGVIAGIAALGALISFDRSEASIQIAERQAVLPPSTSQDWFGPVGDDRGGFVALNTLGASRFSSSVDGATWFGETTWNSRAVDLRTEVSSFTRSGSRYVVTIEAASAITSSVSPYVASSRDLSSWDIEPVDIGVNDAVEGLRTRANILATAATAERVLVAVGTRAVVDYQSIGVSPTDVCVETTTPDSITVFSCDGTRVIDISTEADISTDADAISARLFVRDGSGPFVEVGMPGGADPYSLVSFGTGFAMVEGLSGDVLISEDGRSWRRGYVPVEQNRFVLLAGSATGQALAVQPDVDGWSAVAVGASQGGEESNLPVALDPASVWIKPQLASGPAGWAVFVSTSRPWERTDITLGWAVEVDDWVVSRQPNARIITARSVDGTVTHRYSVRLDSDPEPEPGDTRSVFVEPGSGEGISLIDPATNNVLVAVPQRVIDRSRPATDVTTGPESQVFFSPDGISWRSIWQSSEDTWFGSVAVGDDEVLLSGTQLIGKPIVIPIG